MAGSLAQSSVQTRNNQLITWIVSLVWTTDSNGVFTGTVLNSDIYKKISGSYLFRVKTIPGTSSLEPSSTYTVTLVDADGYDVLGGVGATRSRTAIEAAIPKQDTANAIYGAVLIGESNSDSLTLNVSGPGNSVQGKVKLYLTAAGD